MHLPAVVIRSSTEVDQCRQSRDAERHVDDAQTPWTTEGVGDDDADVDAGALADALADATGARVRVIGQKSDDVGLTHIRLVDPGVCAYKAVPRLGYQHPMRAKYPHAFVEDHLDQARIRRCHQLLGDALRLVTSLDGRQRPKLALRLGHHLLGDHENIGRFERRPRADQVAEVVARMDLGEALHREELDAIHTARRKRARSAGSSRSRAIASEMWISKRTPLLVASRRKAASESAPKCSPIA